MSTLRSLYLGVSSVALLLAGSVGAAGYVGPGKTTLTCIDHDGDDYGTGPLLVLNPNPTSGNGCTGRDADDNDPEVNTVESWKAKHGTIDKLLAARGYTGILRYWFVDYANGDDATCKAGTSDVAQAAPCATWEKIRRLVKPGDTVVFRGGRTPVGNTLPMNVSGTPENPILFIGYPGESFVLDRSDKVTANPDGTTTVTPIGDGISGIGIHDVTFDGFTVYSDGKLGNSFTNHVNPVNVTVHNMEMRNGYTHLRMMRGLRNVRIEKNLFVESKATESVYLGGTRDLPGQDVFFRYNIVANVSGLGSGYPAVQYNGMVMNYVVEGNVVYGAEQCFSFVQGVKYSTFRRNLCFGDAAALLTLTNYGGHEIKDPVTGVCSCRSDGICPDDVNHNLIEENTLVRGRYDRAGRPAAQVPVILFNNRTLCPEQFDLGHTTIQRNILVGWGNQPLIGYFNSQELSKKYLATTKIIDNVFHKVGTTLPAVLFGVGKNGVDYTLMTEAQFAPLTAEYTNNIAADPKFVHYDFSEWQYPERADFHLQPDSPASHAGVYTGEVTLPPTDPPPPPPIPENPVADFDVTPRDLSLGESATAVWVSQYAKGCEASGAWSGQKAPSGSEILTPTVSGTYELKCVGDGGTATTSPVGVTVTATQPEPPPPPEPPVVVGSRIITSDLTDVLNKPNTNSGKLKCKQEKGAKGVVVAGPTNQQGYTWLRIDFETRCDGFVRVQSIEPVP
jgi:hypothetical protein